MPPEQENVPQGAANEALRGRQEQKKEEAPTPAPMPAPRNLPDNDIDRLLKEVKLPERREVAEPAVKKPPRQVPGTAPASELEAAILEEHIVQPAATQGKTPEPPAPQESDSPVVAVRTFKGDLQALVREQKLSLVKAASLEAQKKEGQERFAPEKPARTRASRRTIGVLFAVCILVALGAGALFAVFLVAKEQQTEAPAPLPSILFAERTVSLPLDGKSPQDLKSTLAQARAGQLGSLGSITRIVPTVGATTTGGTQAQVPATIQQFFSALGLSAPQELIGAIGPNFFFGFNVIDTNAPLFVIPVTSYDRAFAGMLAWEQTMNADLSPIFTAVPATITGQDGIPESRTFTDVVLNNYDARALKNDSGTVVLYYSFPTPGLLVIAESPYSFSEILSRLQAQREL